MDVNRDFGRQKAGYMPAIQKSKTHGDLILDGKFVMESNKPFALLQSIKKMKYSHIKPSSRLKIVAHKI